MDEEDWRELRESIRQRRVNAGEHMPPVMVAAELRNITDLLLVLLKELPDRS